MSSKPRRARGGSSAGDGLAGELDKLRVENEGLSSKLDDANTQLAALESLQRDYADANRSMDDHQAELARLEAQIAEHIDALAAAKAHAKDLDRQHRDHDKLAKLHDSEKAAWIEQETAYKDRIASLSAALANARKPSPVPPTIPEEPVDTVLLSTARQTPRSLSPIAQSPDDSQDSFALPHDTLNELAMLQAQLHSYEEQQQQMLEEIHDLRTINDTIKSENESYEALLGEKMMSGALLGQGMLLPELSDDDVDMDEPQVLEASGTGSPDAGAVAAGTDKPSRRAKRQSMAVAPNGMDLAAELDRANEDDDDKEREAEQLRKKKRAMASRAGTEMTTDVEALWKEIRSLKEANKGLSLYVGKIVERVMASGGFEHILATSPTPDTPTGPKVHIQQASIDASTSGTSLLSASIFGGSSTSTARPANDRKKSRLSMGLESLGSSIAKAITPTKEQPTPAGFKPILLSKSVGPGATLQVAPHSSSTVKKLPTQEEDEEDQVTRARLAAEMKLHGITSPTMTASHSATSSRLSARPSSMIRTNSSTTSQRSSITYSFSPEPDPDTSAESEPPSSPPSAKDKERRNSTELGLANIKHLAEEEKAAKAELEKGRASGFTEVPKRISRERRNTLSRSNSVNVNLNVGLGLDLVSNPASPKEERSPSPNEGMMSKAFRRLSGRQWASPPPPPHALPSPTASSADKSPNL